MFSSRSLVSSFHFPSFPSFTASPTYLLFTSCSFQASQHATHITLLLCLDFSFFSKPHLSLVDSLRLKLLLVYSFSSSYAFIHTTKKRIASLAVSQTHYCHVLLMRLGTDFVFLQLPCLSGKNCGRLVCTRMAFCPLLVPRAVLGNPLRTTCWKTPTATVTLSTPCIPCLPCLPRLPPIINAPISVSMELPALSPRAA